MQGKATALPPFSRWFTQSRRFNQDVRPDWIVGTSIGAVTGAILAGNAPEDRLAKLNQFWTEAMVHTLKLQPSPQKDARFTMACTRP